MDEVELIGVDDGWIERAFAVLNELNERVSSDNGAHLEMVYLLGADMLTRIEELVSGALGEW